MNLVEEIKIEHRKMLTRRHLFRDCGLGLGTMALAGLLGERTASARAGSLAGVDALAPKTPHFPGKAKRVIFLFMAGAPSQLDLFDSKPLLQKYNGKPAPAEFLKGQNFAFIKPDAALFASPFRFEKKGQSGAEISEVLPHLGGVVDDIAIVRSMTTDAFNHAPGQIFLQTGSQQFGRPSLGAWVTYGLGSESRDMPAFIVLSSGGGTSGGAGNWGCGFLPTVHQGVTFRRTGDPILSLSNPRGITRSMQRQALDALKQINEEHLAVTGDPEVATRISSFEMAFRMQTSGPELIDLTKESKATLDMYGATPGQASFAGNCLLSRRLLERGSRFVMLAHEAWDHHSEVVKGVKDQTRITDKACAALIKDLKQRGMLEDTLVVWGGEFGRTPMVESDSSADRSMGRDHHPSAYTMWLAGGGIKAGLTLGKTDELGFNVVEDRVHIHDLHATILHCLGFDHTKLVYRSQGRDFRLTDVHGEVVKKLIV